MTVVYIILAIVILALILLLSSKIKLFFDGKLPSLVDEAYKVAKQRDLKVIGKKLKSIYESLNIQ